MNREQLFTNYQEPAPALPAEAQLVGEFGRSPLEGYVMGEMTADLWALDNQEMTYPELAAKQTAILAELAPQIAGNLDPQTAKIIQMDLLFMFGGYIPSDKDMYRNAPPALPGLIGQQCDRFEGLEPYMTYEMIIDVNSAEYVRTGNMRVYTDGEDGKHERDFYLGHHLAEPFARSAAYQLHMLAQRPDMYEAQTILESAREDLAEFNLYMGSYANLPPEAFKYFRQYLGGYADGTRNASGAFMPSVQLLELAMVPSTEMYDVYLDESMRYFPTWARDVIADWRQQSSGGLNVEQQIQSGNLVLDDESRDALIQTVDKFVNFRMTHLGITRKQIKEAFSSLDNLTRCDIKSQGSEQQILDPDYKGTAGFDVRNVLTNSVYRLLNLRERLAGNVG
jgi:hypothetical protein